MKNTTNKTKINGNGIKQLFLYFCPNFVATQKCYRISVFVRTILSVFIFRIAHGNIRPWQTNIHIAKLILMQWNKITGWIYAQILHHSQHSHAQRNSPLSSHGGSTIIDLSESPHSIRLYALCSKIPAHEQRPLNSSVIRQKQQVPTACRGSTSSPSHQGLVLTPRHSASSFLWIFPSLLTSQCRSRMARSLSSSEPVMLGCRGQKKVALN